MSCGSGGCSTCKVSEKRGCGVSSVFDWLYQIDGPKTENTNLVEVQFKGDRKDFYTNKENLEINQGDIVAVEGKTYGHDIGRVTMIGELVALQIARKKRDTKKDPLKKIYRKASSKDIEKWHEATQNEESILEKAKRIIKKFNLQMKLSDVEFQGDNSKATFFYTSEKRVDFRDLIRTYSTEFKVRIEMRQIGDRQESAKIGGIGSCGRELCCSTWMTQFPAVSTGAARYQQLAINPQKISGQCGRLKCCLNFELDAYTEALKDFPSSKTKLKTKQGVAKFVKLDVFKGLMYYFNSDNPTQELLEINKKSVKQLIELNKKGKNPDSFDAFITKKPTLDSGWEDRRGQDNINRFDSKRLKKNSKNKFKSNKKRLNKKQNKHKKDA